MKKQDISEIMEGVPITSIRRTQAAISRNYRLENIAGYYNRDTFGCTARALVDHYFPETVERANTANIEILTEAYRAALLLYPLQYRLKGTYRPDWCDSTMLSWFRRCITEQSRQWWFAEISVPEDAFHDDPDCVADNACAYAGVRDRAGASLIFDQLLNLRAMSGRKSEFAGLILDPFAGAIFDAQMRERFGFTATPAERRRRRARRQGCASYIRRNRTAWVIADRDTVQNNPDVTWCDIRECDLNYGDYQLSWSPHPKRAGGVLNVRVSRQALRSVYQECRGTAQGRAIPRRKAAAISATARKYFRIYRHAAGSLRELQGLDQQIGSLVRKRITAADPAAKYTAGRIDVRSRLTLPIRNPFADPGEICLASWIALFNPYR